MAPAAERLAAALEATPIAAGTIPVYANGSAAPFVDVRRELSENLLKPVRFRETLLAMRAGGVESFVELGPGKVLSGLVKRTLRAAEAATSSPGGSDASRENSPAAPSRSAGAA